MPIDQALYALMDQTGASISFSNQLLPDNHFVTLDVQNEPLGSILEKLLEGTNIGVSLLGKLIVLVPPGSSTTPRKYTLNGTVRDAQSGELLLGANVFIRGGTGTVTNEYGFYSLTLPEGVVQITVSYLGYQSRQLRFSLHTDFSINVALTPSLNLAEVIVTSKTVDALNTYNPTPGLHQFGQDVLNKVPALSGEADVQRIALMLPGVQSGADGFGGISVRGGNIDQNLVLLDGVPVYNSSHLLGLYSVFNPDAVKSVRLLKGVFPARYGGRVSSVLDVRTKEGNLREWTGSSELGLTSIRGLVEGPLHKDSLSLLISARRSLLDLYTRPLSSSIRRKSGIEGSFGYFFYDVNAKLQWNKGSKNRFFLSMYTGGDLSSDVLAQQLQNSDTLKQERSFQELRWGNAIGSLRWNHLFGKKLFLNTTLNYSRFYYASVDKVSDKVSLGDRTLSSQDVFNQYKSNNRDYGAQADFNYLPSPNHHLRFGVSAIWHKFQPGAVFLDETIQIDTLSPETLELLLNKNPQRSRELDFYVEDEFQLGRRWSGNVGFRTAQLFTEEVTYFYVQPRMLVTFQLLDSWHLHASGGRHVQSLHQLSSSGISLPRDLWVSSTRRVAPIDSWQAVLGTTFQWGKGWEASGEVYQKRMDNLIVFLEGSFDQIDGDNWQNEIDVGKGSSRGLEVMLHRSYGKTQGWLSYTLSRTDRIFDEVNQGEAFPFRFDRRHNLTLAANHQLNKKWTLSGLWTFSSGMATTLPRQVYDFNQLNLLNSELPPQFPFLVQAIDNGSRNDIRMPNYHRLDLSASYTWHKPRQQFHLDFGVYNAYVHFNPVYYRLSRRPNEAGEIQSQFVQVALLPILPFFRFRTDWHPPRKRTSLRP